jgi:hypothetical protein
MSNVFAAGYSITYVEDLGSGVWRVTGDIIDYSLMGYTASDAQVDDIVVDEDSYNGTTDRWKITEIVSASVLNLVCKVIWDDEGPEDTSGPVACTGAIARVSTIWGIGEAPTENYAQISEPLKTKFQNINQRHIIDKIPSFDGVSGYMSKFTGTTKLTTSTIYESDTTGTSGYIGFGVGSPQEKIDISKGAVQIEAMDSSPTTPAAGFGKMFMTVEGSSPVTALNYYIADGDATTVVDQTLLTSSVYSDYFVGYTDVWMCDTDDGGFAVLYRVNDGENPITYSLYIRNSSGAEVETITGISVSPIDGRNIFNVGGRLWVCFWDGPVTSPDSGYIRVYEYDGTLTEEITLDAGFVGNNGYIGKPGYFDTSPNAVALFGSGGKYRLYNNSDLSLYSSGTLKVNSITPNFSGKCLTRNDGTVVWAAEMPGPNYPEWYLVELTTEYKYPD